MQKGSAEEKRIGKKGRREGRKEGRKDGRKKGRKEGRKEGGKEGRKDIISPDEVSFFTIYPQWNVSFFVSWLFKFSQRKHYLYLIVR